MGQCYFSTYSSRITLVSIQYLKECWNFGGDRLSLPVNLKWCRRGSFIISAPPSSSCCAWRISLFLEIHIQNDTSLYKGHVVAPLAQNASNVQAPVWIRSARQVIEDSDGGRRLWTTSQLPARCVVNLHTNNGSGYANWKGMYNNGRTYRYNTEKHQVALVSEQLNLDVWTYSVTRKNNT